MKQNIALVTVDSFRADHCSHMGYHKETTPTLDKIAEEGTSFTNAVSPGPRTPESMPVIFTGQFLPDDLPTDMVPQQSIIRKHMKTRYTLPQYMSDRGYETIGIAPNPFTSRYFGFDKGFDHFIDFLGEGDTTIYERLFEGWLGGNKLSNVLRLARNMALSEEVFKPWEAFYQEILDSIESATKPYFLWVFPMDVHEPYIAGDGYHSVSALERWSAIWKLYLGDKETSFSDKTVDSLIKSYDDSIRYTDAFFSKLEEDLSKEKDTTLIVHGDHGEAFGEHEIFSHEPYLYEENIHVPLVISDEIDVDSTQPISLRHLPNIITGIADGEPERGFPNSPYAISRTTQESKISVRFKDWKYISSSQEGILYNLNDGEKEYQEQELETVCEDIVSNIRSQDEEFQKIRDASVRVVGDNQI